MSDNERKLSDYIDSLNSDHKPKEHDDLTESSDEMKELYNAVRLVKSLKDAQLPDGNYPEKLINEVSSRLSKNSTTHNHKRPWFIGITAVAAVLAVVFLVSNLLPLGNTNIVYAMSKAFQEVKAYHGTIEIEESNAEGRTTLQTKLEVWADKKGHYYVKEVEGFQSGLTTVNNGQKKWQTIPPEMKAYVFPAFPDTYQFSFALGKEIDDLKAAVSTTVVGEDNIAGRPSTVIEVTPKGGSSYRIWVDKDTKLPLQKQYAMQNAIQYKITYTSIDFIDSIPDDLLAYNIPKDYQVINTNQEQFVNNLAEASETVGFSPASISKLPEGYTSGNITIDESRKIIKQYYVSSDKDKKIVIIQEKSPDNFKPTSTSVLGKINDHTAEIISPVTDNSGTLVGAGLYSDFTDISSIRWQESGYEYAVIGNVPVQELALFINALTNEKVEIPSPQVQKNTAPKIAVPYDIEIEKNDQKSVDAGHSPWRLDPVYVAQVFVSLKISPQGITGDYPIKYEDLKLIQNDGKSAVVEVVKGKSPISRVYLKRLVRQDSTGIWTVVGYDPSI